MASILSAPSSTAVYKFSSNPNSHFSRSFPIPTSQLTPLRLRLSKPLTTTSPSSNSTGRLVSPVASTAGAGGESLGGSLADAIVLDVRGMSCEGCVSSVKNILESQPQVSSASVDLAKGTAIIWPVAEAKAIPDWQSEVGGNLAKQLTSCGFDSDFQRTT